MINYDLKLQRDVGSERVNIELQLYTGKHKSKVF